MKKTLLTSLLAFSLQIALASQKLFQLVESISGKSFKIIQATLPEVAKNHFDLEKFKIVVMESESSYLVIFDDPKRAEGQRGNTSKLPSFEIELRKDDLQIVRSNFVR